ncbi:hypothetical protein BBJ28_00003837 [Nothophytophthora sp. Chile5]|nr:hypothetical protein BBJ28_00003837 [Nothophytophthora sp. Chile5]
MLVELVIADDGRGLSSIARVSLETFRSLCAAWGGYVSLRCCSAHRPRVFHLEIDAGSAPIGRPTVEIDHWPSCCDGSVDVAAKCSDAPQSGSQVDLRCVAPSAVRVVQYLALAPASDDHPKVALAFVKSLLRQRILTDHTGTTALQRDAVDYGRWTYQAYFRGQSRVGDAGCAPVSPLDVGVVTDQTLVLLFPFTTTSRGNLPRQPIGFHARGFRELVAMALRSSSASSWESGTAVPTVSAPHSLLLHAPSGAGKTTLVLQVAEELSANLLVLDGGLLSSPQLRLEDFFSAAMRIQPCVLLLEDLELLFPMTLDETKYKLVCRLVNCLESIRTQWTLDLLTSLLPSPSTLRREFLMSMTVRYGQRPSNIVSIAQQICMRLSQEDSRAPSVETLESEVAAFAREVSSSSQGADTLSSSVPDVSWDDIGGLESVKQSLLEMVVWPLEKPQVFHRMGIAPPLGMVLHGPPGTGKTMLAKATAKASGCNFLNLAASDLMKAEVGESEKAITRAFDTARALSPCMVFIDEFQSLFGNRSTAGQTTSRMISQLLMELDALKAVSDDSEAHVAATDAPIAASSPTTASAMSSLATGRVFVLAATNCLMVSVLTRSMGSGCPGRFENVVYVGLPNASERSAILEIQRGKMPWHSDVELQTLVEATDGANAASLIALCQAAAIQAMQRVPPSAPVEDQVRTNPLSFTTAWKDLANALTT